MQKLLFISLALGSFVAAHGSTEEGVTCRRIAVPVALSPDQAGVYTVIGQLCEPKGDPANQNVVQLLVHGATYTYDYWDFGRIDGIEFSYARDVAARGIATFAYDALGSGGSSHPPSDQLNIQSAADVAHQIVQALRSGAIGGAPFGKIILVGHSLGSVAVWQEAISYRDVDGLIITGAAHSITSRFLAANAFYPTANDPTFAGGGLDPGYLTTVTGIRGRLFYNDPDDDPVGIAADEASKDVVPAGELMTGLP